MDNIFSQIKFNKEHHTYNYNGQQLTPVSKVIGKVKPPFDADYWAQRKADERGVSKEVILKEWDDNRKASMEMGTRVHEYIERVLLGKETQQDDPMLAWNKIPEMLAFDQFWAWAKTQFKPVYIEWVVGDPAMGIAGTCDVLFQDINTGRHFLCDWKTGKRFNTTNRFQNLLDPFADLQDCELSYYSLQSSLYRLIIETNAGLALEDGYIVHLSPAGQSFVHKAVDLREGLTAWLMW